MRTPDFEAVALAAPPAAHAHADPARSSLPAAPRSLAETGLPTPLLTDLVLKLLGRQGRVSLYAVGKELCLPRAVTGPVLEFLRAERLVEVSLAGLTEVDAQFQLTDNGRRRATEASERCSYVGPAPVPLETYQSMVTAQAASNLRFDAPSVRRAFADVVLAPEIVDGIGAAMNSGRAMLLYGPPGSGKTYLAELLQRLARGTIAVPYAIHVGGEIIQVFDPIHHDVVDAGDIAAGVLEPSHDRRWQTCRRPTVLSGGELTLSMLDLRFDEQARYYQAPAHVKANNGIYIVDDLGRQQVTPRELMNRWIVPLDRRKDYLTLHNGFKFCVPFELTVVFSTNLHPTELSDEAFLRRFGYKVFVGALGVADYRRLFERCCDELAVRFDGEALQWLLSDRHGIEQRPLLACYPRDLIGRIRDLARYTGRTAEMTPESLARAWSVYFVNERRAGPEPVHGGTKEA